MSRPLECVSVIVPTYNERENIVELIPRLARALEESGISYEIVVVDDNSPDKTYEAARELSREYRVKALVRYYERGLSSAIVYGARHASCDSVVVMDADLQHPPEKVPEIARMLARGCDIVVATRYAPGGGISGWSLLRLLESRIALLLAKIMLPPARRTSDPVSGFFGCRRELLLNPDIKPRGYKILLEVLVKNSSARVCEVPYVFRSRARGSSKLGPRTILDYIVQVVDDAIYLVSRRLRIKRR